MGKYDVPIVGNWYDDTENYYDIVPGINRLTFTGKKITCTMNKIAPKLPEPEEPEHSHVHEQAAVTAEGDGDFLVGGKRYRVEKGFFAMIPPHIPHGYSSANAKKLTRNLEFFTPARFEYVKENYIELVNRGCNPMEIMITELEE